MFKTTFYQNRNKTSQLFVFFLLLFPLNAHAWGETKLKQNTTCLVHELDHIVKQCKDGDILIFAPSIFGNEQLPVKVAGLVCNFEHPIVSSVGGLSCVFTTARKNDW
jgi:hypothetical protein